MLSVKPQTVASGGDGVINWGESGEVGWCVADSLGCSWHADEVQSEMLGGFVSLAKRNARLGSTYCSPACVDALSARLLLV